VEGEVKNGKGQKAKEEAKEIGFLKLDTSASNRPTERPPIALFLGSENGHFNWVMGVRVNIAKFFWLKRIDSENASGLNK